MGLPAMRDASQRRAGELHNVDRNVIWWPVRSQVRSGHMSQIMAAPALRLYTDKVVCSKPTLFCLGTLHVEHIDCNTWIVMLRFTVVPLTGFEAFGVVSAELRGARQGARPRHTC